MSTVGQEAVSLYPPESLALPLAYTDMSMAVIANAEKGMLFYMGEKKKVC